MHGLANLTIEALIFSNLWIFLYNNLLRLLNASFPASPQTAFLLLVPSMPEPFEIPLFLILAFTFIILIWLVHKISINLSSLPFFFKAVAFIFLLLVFIQTLGGYPMAGEYSPYPSRADPTIYFFLITFYIGFWAALIAISFILEKYIGNKRGILIVFYVFIACLIALMTFDAGFPMTGHDYEYFLGPSWEIIQGKTVYTDIYSQYGFLTPILFAILHKLYLVPLIYISFVIWILYISQYLICFFIIKKISKSLIFSLLALSSLMTINYFSLIHLPSVIPQVGPFRWFPMIILLALFCKLEKFESKKFIVVTAFLSLFMIDIGLAIIMAYGLTLFIFLLGRIISFKKAFKSIIFLCLSFFTTLLIINILHILLGYKFVNLLSALQALRKHALLGFTMIPIQQKNYFWMVILIYFSSMIYFFSRPSRLNRDGREPTGDANRGIELLTLIFSANLSLFASVYFVGRSHPHNLFHISIFPILTLFILTSQILKNIPRRLFLLFYILYFILLVIIPAYQRRFTLAEMLLTKYHRAVAGNIFNSEVDTIISNDYKRELALIKDQILEDKIVVLSSDDTYILYKSGKQNLLDVNPIMAIDLPADLDFAVKNAIKACPRKIVMDCSYVGKCPTYTPFVGVTFRLNLILDKIEKGCGRKYTPSVCTNKLCVLE